MQQAGSSSSETEQPSSEPAQAQQAAAGEEEGGGNFVGSAQQRRLFVSNVPERRDVGLETVRALLAEPCGEVAVVYRGQERGTAVVEFVDRVSVSRALTLQLSIGDEQLGLAPDPSAD